MGGENLKISGTSKAILLFLPSFPYLAQAFVGICVYLLVSLLFGRQGEGSGLLFACDHCLFTYIPNRLQLENRGSLDRF